MAGKIFIRERRKVVEGEKKPRFTIVGVEGTDLRIFAKHIRKSEIEQISQQIGAEVVMLKHGKDDEEIDNED
ncbi:MAG TPA: hypothetical protein VHQ70_06285 [Syntrophomonadaceae bacterium]|nr:hypothetical protein [Syntrophomonadaceae bacterium]